MKQAKEEAVEYLKQTLWNFNPDKYEHDRYICLAIDIALKTQKEEYKELKKVKEGLEVCNDSLLRREDDLEKENAKLKKEIDELKERYKDWVNGLKKDLDDKLGEGSIVADYCLLFLENQELKQKLKRKE